MKKLKYPLFVSDFDGTLLRSDGTIADETKRAIEKYRQDGGVFTICTGRMLTSILPIARALGLKGLVASYQGAVIADVESGKTLLEGYMTSDEAVQVCRVFESMGLHIHVYELTQFYCNRGDAILKEYEALCGVKGIVYDEKPLSALIKEKNLKVVKVLAMVSPEEKMRVYERACANLDDRFYVTYSAAFLVEVSPRRYSKATALQFLADKYGVPMERVMAVGDSLNDLPMIEAAGKGFTVQNADDMMKKNADVFPFSCDEDAVGKMIAQYAYESGE